MRRFIKRYDIIQPMKKTEKKESAIEKLAIMVKEGFDKTATREDFKELKGDIVRLETKIDDIESKLVGAHDRRIEKLEDRMIQVRTVLKMK